MKTNKKEDVSQNKIVSLPSHQEGIPIVYLSKWEFPYCNSCASCLPHEEMKPHLLTEEKEISCFCCNEIII